MRSDTGVASPGASAARWYYSPSRLLATFVTASGTGSRKFIVTNPPVTTRLKVSIMFVPKPPQLPVPAGLGFNGTLWLYEAEDQDAGVSGQTIPCTDIEGTAAAPSNLFASAGLYGYSREFVTAADYVEGIVALTGGGGGVGDFLVTARWQPNASAVSADEWNQLTTMTGLRVQGGPLTLG
jgi:hypothetical protein